MKKPANLQLTVKDAGRLMNVSARSIYTAKRVARLRPDLVAKVEAGEMSMHEADMIATGKAKPTRLVTAWNNATDDDRDRLALAILTADRSARKDG